MKGARSDAGRAVEIDARSYAREAVPLEQSRDLQVLIASVLEQQRSAGLEMRSGTGDDRSQGLEARRAARECERGLGNEHLKRGIPVRNVRRVAGDQVEALARDRLEP